MQNNGLFVRCGTEVYRKDNLLCCYIRIIYAMEVCIGYTAGVCSVQRMLDYPNMGQTFKPLNYLGYGSSLLNSFGFRAINILILLL